MIRRVIPYIIIGAVATLVSCSPKPRQSDNKIYVTIPPLKELVTEIVGDDFDVEVILPQGASPETFELSARKMADIGGARLVFATSLLDFEKSLTQRIADRAKVVNTSRNIALIEGSCSHHHPHNPASKPQEEKTYWASKAETSHAHHHGIDPHIWSSPKALMQITENIYNAIRSEMPDSVKYHESYVALGSRLLDLNEECRERCKTARLPYFIIYHPALTYLARDYGLEQVAIEQDGKEPSAKRIAEIIDRARRDGIRRVFYQSEYPRSVVETICNDIGAEAVEIDPLNENCIENLRQMVELICQ